MNKKISPVKIIAFVVASILAVVISQLTPPAELTPQSMTFMGIFIWWLVMMCIEIIPGHLTCIAALTLCVAFGVDKATVVFSQFGSTTVWLLIGAFGLAAGLQNSGLLKRLALLIMSLFPASYKGQLIGVSVASLVIAPTIPSTSAKASVIIPLTAQIAEEMGYQPHSKGTVGLWNAANVVTNFVGMMFMTGGLVVPTLIAVSGQSFTWMGYLKASWVWGVVLLVGTIVYLMIAYNPEKAGEAPAIDKAAIKAKLTELGRMSKKEIIALIVMIATVALWLTESIHGIPTFAVALIAWIVLAAVGLFSAADFMTKILWPVFVLTGGILGIVTLISTTGVGSWLASVVGPYISIFSSNAFILVIALIVFATAMRFAMISASVIAVLFVTLLGASGIVNPFVIAFVCMMAGQVYILSFQNVGVITSVSLAAKQIDFKKDVTRPAIAFVIINAIALIASIPWWSIIGYIG